MFQFKQFTIQQDRCAMKVGTDGVLLGAWAPTHSQDYSILDVGAGTGLIALMLAQRTHAEQIDAIEIDDDAYEQCVENFEQSPWNDRLFCYHAGLDEFIEEFEGEESYDLIVSNPPFFSENYNSPDEQRNTARFQKALPFELLVQAATTFLADNGRFCVVLPFTEETNFIELSQQQGLFCTKILRVRGMEHTPIKRSLLCFEKTQKETEITDLTIEISRHEYTSEYKELTKDFYLNF